MTNNQPRQLFIPHPPRETFAHKPTEKQQDVLYNPRSQHERIPEIDRIIGAGEEWKFKNVNNHITLVSIGAVKDAPSRQGWFVYHVGKKYPMKGFPFPQALTACEPPKRMTIWFTKFLTYKGLIPFYILLFLVPKKVRIEIITRLLKFYIAYADGYLLPYYPENKFFMEMTYELKGFITLFLMKLGFDMIISSKVAYIFSTFIEYDTAYRWRMTDLLSETTKEKMMADPGGEAMRLLAIMADRESKPHLVKKFQRFAMLLKYGSFIFKKPFRYALKEVDFTKFQYDDIARDEIKHYNQYKFFGKTDEERMKEYPLENYPHNVLNPIL